MKDFKIVAVAPAQPDVWVARYETDDVAGSFNVCPVHYIGFCEDGVGRPMFRLVPGRYLMAVTTVEERFRCFELAEGKDRTMTLRATDDRTYRVTVTIRHGKPIYDTPVPVTDTPATLIDRAF